jgi:competence protein ComK
MNYEINFDTQLLLPIDEKKTKIIEQECEYIVEENINKIMEHSCEYFGSSYEGRKEGTKKLLGITHKSPIIVEESKRMIFFPTASTDNIKCIWISLDKIDKYYRIDNKNSAIKFKNGNIINLNISYGSLTNQILRASRLKYVLEERISLKKDNII